MFCFKKGSIVAYFIEKDGFEMWSAPLQEFILWMNSNEMSIISTGLELFLVIIGKIETKINSIVPLMMSTLFQVFAVPEVYIYSIKLLNISIKFLI